MKRDFGLDQKGFLLLATPAGNDYDGHKGLKNCGLKMALEAAKAGCSHALWECGNSIQGWRIKMANFFQQKWIKIELPGTFPGTEDLPTLSQADNVRRRTTCNFVVSSISTEN